MVMFDQLVDLTINGMPRSWSHVNKNKNISGFLETQV